MPIRKVSKLATMLLATSLFAGSTWYLVEHFEWRVAFAELFETDLLRLISLVLMIHFAYICVRTWRWRLVVKYANPKVRFFDLYLISAVVVSLANLTPGQLGEALKIEMLKRRRLLGRLPGFGAFALERILDLLVVASMGALGLVYGSGLATRYPGLATGTAILLGLGLVAFYVLLSFDPGGRASHWLGRMRTGSGSPKIWIKMTILTVISWSLVGAGWQVSLYAVGIHLSFPEILWLISIVTLGTLVSFIPGGLGVAELVTVEVLVGMGIAPVAAQTGALVLRTYGLVIVFFGFAHLMLWPIIHRAVKVELQDPAN